MASALLIAGRLFMKNITNQKIRNFILESNAYIKPTKATEAENFQKHREINDILRKLKNLTKQKRGNAAKKELELRRLSEELRILEETIQQKDSCPIIPVELKNIYSKFAFLHFANYNNNDRYRSNAYEIDFNNICRIDDTDLKQACNDHQQDMEGGHSTAFLLAILSFTNMRVFTSMSCWCVRDNDNDGVYIKTPEEYIDMRIVRRMQKNIKCPGDASCDKYLTHKHESIFDILKDKIDSSTVNIINAPIVDLSEDGEMNHGRVELADIKKVFFKIIEEFSDHDLSIKAFHLSVYGVDKTVGRGHAMAAFPCKNDIIMCNSWGNNCYEKIDDFLQSAEAIKLMDLGLRTISIVL
jgi:hypothetical protein